MADIPNIPSVVVTIEDQSYLEPIISSGRTVLIPFFSKYGKEDFVTWATWDEYQTVFGTANPRKYGMAQLFIKGASQYTQSFLGKRLLPSDAAYANKIKQFSNSGINENSLPNYTQAEAIIADAGDRTIVFYGNGRGAGYNDIVVKFKNLEEYERFYADENGIPKYQFNFLAATIYEKQADGSLVQLEQDMIPFALVDVDPENGAAIKDIYDSMSLNISERFELVSNYLRSAINDQLGELSENLGPKDIDPVLFWDAAVSKAAYIIFEDGDITLEYIDADQSQAVEQARFHYVDASGNDAYAIVKVDNNQILISDDTASGALTGDLEEMKIFSSKAFYVFKISDRGNFIATDTQKYQTVAKDGQLSVTTTFDCVGAAVIVDDVVMIEGEDYTVNGMTINFTKALDYGQNITIISASTNSDPVIKLEQFKFSRYNLWKDLIEKGVQLENGFDGENLYLNGTLNFDGPGEDGKENAKMLLIDFYAKTPELREVLYPKYTFDYVPDFTNNPYVQAAIVNLCDSIQTALGIHSTGIKYNYQQDLDHRKYKLGISSFCNALYSGEANKRHYDSDLGRTIVMPSNYYALLNHLYVDATYDIAEPVANVNKGTLRTGTISLTYTPTTLEIEKLRQRQINAIIDEADGVYFIDQLTMYKKASILSRIHAIKPIMQVKKDLRKILKDFLQAKSGKVAVAGIRTVIDEYMKDKIYDSQKNRTGWFEYYKYEVIFDENKLEINVLLTIKPPRSIEKITLNIGVV